MFTNTAPDEATDSSNADPSDVKVAGVDSFRDLAASGSAPVQVTPAAWRKHQQLQPTAVVTAKSAGLAVLLTIVWLGAGHLYAGRVATGIALMLFDSILVLLAFSLLGIIIAVPVWIVAAPITMVFAASAASAFNRRNGITVQ